MLEMDARYRAIEKVEFLMLEHNTNSLDELKDIIKKEILEEKKIKEERKEKLKSYVIEKFTGRLLDKKEQTELYNLFKDEFDCFINVSSCLRRLNIRYEYEKVVNPEDNWRGLTLFKEGI